MYIFFTLSQIHPEPFVETLTRKTTVRTLQENGI